MCGDQSMHMRHTTHLYLHYAPASTDSPLPDEGKNTVSEGTGSHKEHRYTGLNFLTFLLLKLMALGHGKKLLHGINQVHLRCYNATGN